MFDKLHKNPFTMTEEKFFENCKLINDYEDPCNDSSNDEFANLFNAKWHPDYDHSKVAEAPVVNLWATAVAAYIALTIWVNMFPEWTPGWLLGGPF